MGDAMMRLVRRLLLVLAVPAALLLPAVACIPDSPEYTPQTFNAKEGPGPSGTTAFSSGEAAKTAMKPVKDGARIQDAGTTEDATTSTDAKTPAQKEDTGQIPMMLPIDFGA